MDLDGVLSSVDTIGPVGAKVMKVKVKEEHRYRHSTGSWSEGKDGGGEENKVRG